MNRRLQALFLLSLLGAPLAAIFAQENDPFVINPGLNDAWYYPPTSGQGFFINVFPTQGTVTLSWFTYDTEAPPADATAVLGDPGHRWLTAAGPFDGATATLSVFLTTGGVFDQPEPAPVTNPTPIGTIEVTWNDCSSAELRYDFLGLMGTIPLQRVVNDNVSLCEAFLSENPPVR